MKPIKIVLDTNVYIAAAINPDSILYKLVEDSAANNLAEYYTSPEILAELQTKLEAKFGFARAEIVTWINHLERALTVIRPTIKLSVIRDPDDNKILECAVEAKADIIISADKDLTTLKEYKNIKIVHPSSLKYIFPTLNSK